MTDYTPPPNPYYYVLSGVPFLTINPSGSTANPNNGANYGPQTTSGSTAANVTGPPYTTSTGLQEFLNTLPSSGGIDQTSSYAGFILPGNVNVTSTYITVNAPYLNLIGCGKSSTNIRWNQAALPSSITFGASSPGWPVAAPSWTGYAFMYWPNSNNSGGSGSGTAAEGTYLGHFGINLDGKAWNYGMCIGNPGGNTPDVIAAGILLEHLVVQSDTGTTGVNSAISGPPYGASSYLPLNNAALCLSTVEDALALQCDFGGAGSTEWIINNGSGKIIAGNWGNTSAALITPCTQFTITDSVLVNVVVGNTGGSGGNTGQSANYNIIGNGFNGSTTQNIQVVPMYSSNKIYLMINLDGPTMGLTSGAPAGNAWIGPYVSGNLTGMNGTMALVNSVKFSSATTAGNPCPLFTPSSNAWAQVNNAFISGNSHNTAAGFLGTGNFITGNLLDPSLVMWTFQNGALLHQGVISTPFGTATTTWGGSSGSAVGPGVSSGSSSPTSATTYTVAFVPLQIVCSGGSGVSITIKDQAGTTLGAGISALSYPGAILQPGETINFTYSSAPTVVVSGI